MYDLPHIAPKDREPVGVEVGRRAHQAVQKCMATCALACVVGKTDEACLQHRALEVRFRQELVTGGVTPRFRQAEVVTANEEYL